MEAVKQRWNSISLTSSNIRSKSQTSLFLNALTLQAKSIVVDEIEVFTQPGHKAIIRWSGTFHETGVAIDLQREVEVAYNNLVN